MTALSDYMPQVCIGLISYNDEKIIGDALASIYSQDYPPEKLKVLVVDGGSTDRTIDILNRTKATIVSRPDLKNLPHVRGEIAVSTVPCEIFISFSADNRFLEADALKKMVAPFRESEIAGVGSWRYGLRKSDPLLCRYYALIGGADPIAVALGKADRAPHDARGWTLRGRVEDRGEYFKVTYESDPAKIPTLGANGFAYRKAFLDSVGGMKNALHMEACVKLVQAGYKFAAVKDCHVVHLHNDLWTSLKRRVVWAELYSGANMNRLYHVYDPKKDRLKLVFVTMSFLTLVLPLLRAFRGYWRCRDAAWFLHPVVGLAFVFSYAFMTFRQRLHGLKMKASGK